MRLSISKNIGRADLLIRLIISASMVYFGFFDLSLIQDEFSATIVGIFGALNLVVALIQFCPLYAVVGINTYCKSRSEN
jgi:hypothetical protein